MLSAHINLSLTCCALTVLGDQDNKNQDAAIEKLTGQTIYTFIIYSFSFINKLALFMNRVQEQKTHTKSIDFKKTLIVKFYRIAILRGIRTLDVSKLAAFPVEIIAQRHI